MDGKTCEEEIPGTMNAMVLERPGTPLVLSKVTVPDVRLSGVLVKIIACGVCRTDLHIIDGELSHPKLPLIPGHEIVGTVVRTGNDVRRLKKGDVVGIPWLGHTCGQCFYCRQQQENLCDYALFTGYTLNGGYAEYIVVDEQYCFRLHSHYCKPSTAPLLCAGLIGYRSYTMIGKNVERLAIYGFGAAAHILVQIAVWQGKKIYAFTKKGDTAAQKFALDLGAVWAGDSEQQIKEEVDAAIIFAPAGDLVLAALQQVRKGGTVVCGGIHMSDIPSFHYDILWGERTLRSVANLTRKDGEDFFKLISGFPITTAITTYNFREANKALNDLRNGCIKGAAVLTMD